MYHIIHDIIWDEFLYYSNEFIIPTENNSLNVDELGSTGTLEFLYEYIYLQPNDIFKRNIYETIKDFVYTVKAKIETRDFINENKIYRFKLYKVSISSKLIKIYMDYEINE